MKHKLKQIVKAHGSQKSEYVCENLGCNAKFAIYDGGDIERAYAYVEYYPEKDLSELKAE